MSKPVDWTVGTPASILIASARQVSGYFLLDGASAREVLYRLDGSNVTSYIVYDDDGCAIKRVDLTGKAHAEIKTPHVEEYERNRNPETGCVFVKKARKSIRPARREEVP